jgi:putative transposase
MSDPNGGRSSATSRRLSAPDHPNRKQPAHFPTVESGSRSIIIFLTVCTKERRPLLANDRAAALLLKAWKAATFWIVRLYVILPDHLHMFCAPNTFPPQPLKKWIMWKIIRCVIGMFDAQKIGLTAVN